MPTDPRTPSSFAPAVPDLPPSCFFASQSPSMLVPRSDTLCYLEQAYHGGGCHCPTEKKAPNKPSLRAPQDKIALRPAVSSVGSGNYPRPAPLSMTLSPLAAGCCFSPASPGSARLGFPMRGPHTLPCAGCARIGVDAWRARARLHTGRGFRSFEG
jgi:hypothetical protein